MCRRLNIYSAKSEVLQAKYPRPFNLYPVGDWWYLDWGGNTEFCDKPGHKPNCIRYITNWAYASGGEWKLKVPINIQGEMPGSEHELDFVSLKAGSFDITFPLGATRNRELRIFADDDIVFEALRDHIALPDNRFDETIFPNIAQSIAGYNTLQVGLYAAGSCLAGGFVDHFMDIKFSIRYVPDVPPEPSTVRIFVTNRETGNPVNRAYVALKEGTRVVADGYTGSDGWVEFQNVPGGTVGIGYDLTVTASGYYSYTDTVLVQPGVNSFNIELTPTPTEPPPWWTWWLVGGVVAIGAITILPSVLKREKPIYVVR